MHDLRFRLFGFLELHAGAQALPKPPTLKSQSLLAYLLVHRQQPHPREYLAEMFWGDRPEEKAMHSLATSLWHIRRCLGDGLILSDQRTVQFDPQADLWLDADVFAALAASKDLVHLREATALYRGEFLAGFYDDWVISERYRLELLHVEALARLMAGCEAQGDHETALATALRLLECDPLREDAHRLAMRAYCHLGQRNAALDQYRRCQEVMQKELGAEPMPETVELYKNIRAGRFAIAPTPIATLPAPPAQPPAAGLHPLDALARGKLVGREREMARLQAHWVAAKAGRGLPVLIRGEAGAGKTRLVEEFSQRAGWQGGRVLWGRSFEFERILPYQPVAEALHSVAPLLSADELATFPAWVLGEVARLAPEIGELRPDVRAPAAPDHERLFDGVARFLAELSSHGPILIVLEDLHWATEPTLEMVHHLAQRLAGRPAMLLLTFRPEALAPDHPLSTMARRLDRAGLAEIMPLPPLTRADVAQFVAEMSGRGEEARALAERLYQETEGNPFFLRQVIKALFEAGALRLEGGVWQGDFGQVARAKFPLPATLGEAILARARRVQPETQEALGWAAVLGREFDFDLLAAAWGRPAPGRDEEATLAAIDELLRHRLIEEGTGPLGRDYAFTHHKIQEVLYADLSQRRRQHIHAQVGASMERVYAGRTETLAAELAFHFEQGRGHEPALAARALHYLWLAGDRARTLYAGQEAVDYYQRALVVAKDAGNDEAAAHTLLRLGLTHHGAYAFEAARQSYDEGFALWQRAEAARRRASVLPPAPHPFRLLYTYYPITVDPILGDASVTHHVFSGLVEESPEMEVIPDAVWRWEMLDGGRRYIFHLRPDATWTDGAPVTAGDFEFAWKRVLSQRDAPVARFLYEIEGAQALHEGRSDDPDRLGVRAVDDLTLEVTLATPAAYFLHLLALPAAFPIPRHVVERYGETWTQPEHIASNGAFRLLSWRAGDKIVLVRNPDYRGRFTGNVQEIHLLLTEAARADWRVGLAMYEANEVDALMIANMPQEALTDIDLRLRPERKLLPIFYTVALGFDVRQPPFDDLRVRQALIMATDVQAIRIAQRKDHWVVDQGGWIPAGMPGHRPRAGLPYDPDRARQLLADAGFPGGKDFPLMRFRSFWTPEGNETTPTALAQIRDALGIESVLEWSERRSYLADLAAHRPQGFMLAWWGNYPDPDDWLRHAMVQMQRFTGWQNPAYDRLVEEARRVFDPAARLQLYRQAEDLLLQEASVGPLFYPHIAMLMKPWLQHYAIAPMQGEQGWKGIVIGEH